MCGITGFIQYKGGTADELARRCQSMADTIAHRGPDAGGVWVDSSFPLACLPLAKWVPGIPKSPGAVAWLPCLES